MNQLPSMFMILGGLPPTGRCAYHGDTGCIQGRNRTMQRLPSWRDRPMPTPYSATYRDARGGASPLA